MAGNKHLGNAKQQKKDEFYTQLSDIENELQHYRDFFRGKTVLCNCDDPFESNFFKYFAMNFRSLGLKRVITTCFAASPVAGDELEYYENQDGQISFFRNPGSVPANGKRRPYRVVINEVEDLNGDGRVDLADVEYLMKNRSNVMTLLDGDGDFRSAECIELLKQADVVVTNPPFSLFREYMAQLIQYQKHFVIIGNMNAIHYKEVFPLIQDNKVWIGPSIHSGDRAFNVPDDYPLNAAGCGIDKNGRKFIRVKGVRWFTNIDIEKRHENMILFRNYDPAVYPTYVNYDAIEVGKTADIPCDYFGKMGVPDTFLQSYNPEQFEIVGLAESELGLSIGVSANLTDDQMKGLKNENPSFRRGNPVFRDEFGKLKKPYSRIIIRRKAAEE